VEFRGDMDAKRNTLVLVGNRMSITQPVLRHFTEAIWLTVSIKKKFFKKVHISNSAEERCHSVI